MPNSDAKTRTFEVTIVDDNDRDVWIISTRETTPNVGPLAMFTHPVAAEDIESAVTELTCVFTHVLEKWDDHTF